jgi:hypothetical protein
MVARQALLRITGEAVDRHLPLKEGLGSSESALLYRQRGLLVLLAFCYVRGIYSSSEIAAQYQEAGLGFAQWLAEAPDWNDIRTFRRLNRVLLRRVLADILGLIPDQAILGGAVHSSLRDLKGVDSDDEQDKPGKNTGLYLAEADNIIRQAIQADSMVMDE